MVKHHLIDKGAEDLGDNQTVLRGYTKPEFRELEVSETGVEKSQELRKGVRMGRLLARNGVRGKIIGPWREGQEYLLEANLTLSKFEEGTKVPGWWAWNSATYSIIAT